MFSSPGIAPSRRPRATGAAESIAGGSIRSSRAGTPSNAAYAGAGAHRASVLRSGRASFAPSRASFVAGDEVSEEGSSVSSNAAQGSRRQRISAKDEVDSDELMEGTVLSRDDLVSITAFSRMPLQAKNALQAASSYDPITAFLDPSTGYAQLITRHHCYIWSFVTPSYEAPPCFVLESMTSSSSASSNNSHLLMLCRQIARGKDREPGLLMLSPSGLLRYHDNLSSSMTSHRRQDTPIGLQSGEAVTELHRCQDGKLIVSTSQSRLFTIRLSASSGHTVTQVAPFAQSRGFLGRFFNAAPSLETGSSGITSVASRPVSDGGLEILALSATFIQKWIASDGRAEKLIYSEDAHSILSRIDDRIVPESASSASLRLLDLSLSRDDEAAVLYGFSVTPDGPMHFGLALFRADAGELNIHSQHSIQYCKMADSRPYTRPRIAVPFGGPIVLVILSEAIITRCLGHQGFEEVIELRESPEHRIIGSSCEGAGFEAPRDISRATIVTQSSGTILLNFNTKQISHLADLIDTSTDRAAVDTRRLKSKLERGVFHSDSALNPISFDLSAEVRGDLMSAAEQLSGEIVMSASPAFSTIFDLRLQLAARLERLHSLVVFLASNGRLGQLSQNCLRRLCADAQLVAAAIDLWDLHTESLRGNARQGSDTLLHNAIEHIVAQRRVEGGDTLRAFFKFYVKDLVLMLQAARAIVHQSTAAGLVAHSAAVYETNLVFLAATQASARYRRETAQLYRLDEHQISAEVWTSSELLVQMIRQQTASTASIICERTRQLGSSIDIEHRELLTDAVDDHARQQRLQQELKGQLCELVARALDAYEERLAYLRVAMGKQPSLERDFTKLEAEYFNERGQLTTLLVPVGRLDRALHLAEEHKDFSTLTHLSTSLPPRQRDFRLHSYIDRYGWLFASALFTYYVDHGEVHTLLQQNASIHGLLKRYLDEHSGLDNIAWLHDLAIHDLQQAARRLAKQADNERASAASKKLMLSLGKLCHVSQLTELQIATQTEQSAIEAYDDQLDLINVHTRIKEIIFSSTDDRNADAVSSLLGEVKPGLKSFFCRLAGQLMEGKAMLAEDLIDLLTLHDPSDSSHADFALAVEVFVRSKSIPLIRADSARAALWRRIILFDDWPSLTQTANLSDEQVGDRLRSTALFQTLLSALSNDSTAETILAPSQCGLVPPLEALQARIAEAMLPTPTSKANEAQGPESSPHALLGQLMQDFRAEAFDLEEVMSAANLDQWFAEVRRLALETLAGQDDGGLDSDPASSEVMVM